jgi:prophage antirepressor-like protein
MATETAVLSFQETTFEVIDWQGQPWLRLPQIEGALGYGNKGKGLQTLFDRNAAEFTPAMTEVIDLPTAGGIQPVRIFSLRGAHLLGMLARTERAAEFRRWVLDVLEGRVAPQQAGTMTYGQRLAYLRERRMLVKALTEAREPAAARELHENLRHVSGLLRITPQALEQLAPATRAASSAGGALTTPAGAAA